jgi:hypothetical protein
MKSPIGAPGCSFSHLQADLLEMVVHFLDHFDHAPQPDVAADRVDLGADVVLGAVAGAGAALHGILHRLDHDRAIDQLLARDRIGNGEQFGLVGRNGATLAMISLPLLSSWSSGRPPGRPPPGKLRLRPRAERGGGGDQPVGHDQLGRLDCRERSRVSPSPGTSRSTSVPSKPFRSPLYCLRPFSFSARLIRAS